MSPNDCEQELGRFSVNYRRIYRYKQPFIPDHFVSIIKNSMDEFEVIMSEQNTNTVASTTNIADFNKELFLKMLIKEELVFESSYSFVDVVELRTGGCECGAFATQNPNNHIYWCKRYDKY